MTEQTLRLSGLPLRRKLFVPPTTEISRGSRRIIDHPFLMFYGTLREGHYSYWVDMPKSTSVKTGARMLGHLYLIGSRPVFIPQRDAAEVVDASGKRYESVYVVGDLVDLSGSSPAEVEAIIRTLDSKEGVHPTRPALGRYIRRLIPVHLPDSIQPILAWVYCCPERERAEVLAKGVRIESGDYVEARNDPRFASPRFVRAQEEAKQTVRSASFEALIRSLDIDIAIAPDIDVRQEPMEVLEVLAEQNPMVALQVLAEITQRRFSWMRELPELLARIGENIQLVNPESFRLAVKWADVIHGLSENMRIEWSSGGNAQRIVTRSQTLIGEMRQSENRQIRNDAGFLLRTEADVRLKISADQQDIQKRISELLDHLKEHATESVWFEAFAVEAVARLVAHGGSTEQADRACAIFIRLLENDYVSKYPQDAVVKQMVVLASKMSPESRWRWARFVTEHPYDPDIMPWTWDWEAAFATLGSILPADELAFRFHSEGPHRPGDAPVQRMDRDILSLLRDRDFGVFQRAVRALAGSGHELVAWASKEADLGQRHRSIVFLEGVIMAALGWPTPRRQERVREVLHHHAQYRTRRLQGRHLYLRKGAELEWWPKGYVEIFPENEQVRESERLNFLGSQRVYAMVEAFGLLTSNEGFAEHATYPTASGETQVHNFELFRRVGLMPEKFSYSVHWNYGLPFDVPYFCDANPTVSGSRKDSRLRRHLDLIWTLMSILYASDERIDNLGSVQETSANIKFPFRFHKENVLVDPSRLEWRVLELSAAWRRNDLVRMIDYQHHLTVALFAPEIEEYQGTDLEAESFEELRRIWASFAWSARQFLKHWGLAVPDYFTERNEETKARRAEFEGWIKALRRDDRRFYSSAERILSAHFKAIDAVIHSRTNPLRFPMLPALVRPEEPSII